MGRGACVRGVLAMKEHIQHEPQDETAWICLCGNMPDTDGFAPCDTSGDAIEPTEADGWKGHYRCERCYRVIHQDGLQVTGVAHRSHRLTWRGIEIVARYTSRRWDIIGHLEIRSIAPKGAPLPGALTGYLSQFMQARIMETHGGDVVAYVVALLDEEAAQPEWLAHVEASRQLRLF